MDTYSRNIKHRKSLPRVAADIVSRTMGKGTKPFVTETKVSSTMPFPGAKKVKAPTKKGVKGARGWYPSGPTSNGIGVGY